MMSEESRRKFSEARKGENNPNFGKRHSEESRRKRSEAQKGKRHSEESRRKMSEAKKGTTTHLGCHHSEETRRKISEARKGKRHSEETRQKISDTLKRGVYHHTKYMEIHGVDEIVFMSMSEHNKLHNRLRREGKCNIPPDMLYKVSRAARDRLARNG